MLSSPKLSRWQTSSPRGWSFQAQLWAHRGTQRTGKEGLCRRSPWAAAVAHVRQGRKQAAMGRCGSLFCHSEILASVLWAPANACPPLVSACSAAASSVLVFHTMNTVLYQNCPAQVLVISSAWTTYHQEFSLKCTCSDNDNGNAPVVFYHCNGILSPGLCESSLRWPWRERGTIGCWLIIWASLPKK